MVNKRLVHKSKMIEYIEKVRSILNDDDWIKFRSEMSSVTLHSLNIDNLTNNDKKEFVEKTAIEINDIFQKY